MSRLIVLLAALAVLAPRPGRALRYTNEARKATDKQLSVEVQRIELSNGLVLLLAPEPSDHAVMVRTTLRAGALFEPPGRSGMAHLVEHLMASGPTPDTDYEDLLERRHARYFNAHTDFDTMSFDCIVPPEELPAALWVAADRYGALPALIDQALVDRHRRVVLEERALRNVDAPYGLVDEQMFRRVYAAPHPLHGGVTGVPDELAAVTADDVRAFVSRHFVPANTILTVVGRFDPAVARRLVEEGLGSLPPGTRPEAPELSPRRQEFVESKDEVVSREPRVAMAWRLPYISHEDALALGFGAEMLSALTDGAWGMRLSAGLVEYEEESLFLLDLRVPYAEKANAVQQDAEAFLRQLTGREMPFDAVVSAHLSLDRSALFELDTVDGRTEVVSRLERRFGNARLGVSRHLAAHWTLDPVVVHDVARKYLGGPRVNLHARPLHPRPPRLERK